MRRVGAVASALCMVTGGAIAASDAPVEKFALQESGWLRGWVIEGPKATDDASSLLTELHASGNDRAHVQGTNSAGVLDFNDRFKLHGAGSPTLIAKGMLEVTTQTEGWLLVRADGWLTIKVDGETKLSRQTPVLRARAWDAIALSLKPGIHSVRLDSKRLNDRWTLAARFIDNSGQAPAGTFWRLPRLTSNSPNAQEDFDVSLELSGVAPAGLLAKISAPLGSTARVGEQLSIRLAKFESTDTKQFKVGTWPQFEDANHPIVVQVGLLDEWLATLNKPENKLMLEVSAGQHRLQRKLNLSRELLNAWQCVSQRLTDYESVPRTQLDVPSVTLQLALKELSAAATQDRTIYEVHRAAAKAQALCESFEKGRMPWTVAGVHDLGFRASADASLQAFALQVPPAAESGATVPLVVVLHGYNSTSSRILDAFLDVIPEKPTPSVNGFVLAPAAHGNTFYRGSGERDVLEILDWALQTLPVDKNRVTITGVSMGGTGTAEIALHYPDRFAAHAPLCGYHSFYVRRDTSGQPIRAWEKKLMHRNSAASSADSGRHLPMYLAHGLKDLPLENSKVLTARYKGLGYSMIEDWPNLGHSVWKKTWAHAGLFPWLSAQTRVEDPARITIAATALRHAKNQWLALTELDTQADLSQMDATISAGNAIRITSKAVVAFTLGQTRHIDPSQPLRLDIDGTELTAAANSPLHFCRREGTFHQCPPGESRRKHAGAEGPWVDLWSEPLVFVYGTGNPSTVGVNLDVARAFASAQGGNDVAYPVISDTEYATSSPDPRTAILVGSSSDHGLLKRWATDLPMSTDAETIRFAGRQFKGDKLGAIYVYPHPDNPTQVIGVITAPTPLGLWQALSLPVLLPDFFVFDSRTSPAAGEPILGRRARVLAAGFFNNDWALPAQLNDPIDESML